MRLGKGVASAVCLVPILYLCACDYTHRDHPGGKWEVEIRKNWLPDAGAGQQSLYRVVGNRRLQVAPVVGAVVYIEEDCVLFTAPREPSGRRYLAACGDRMPVVLRESPIDDWDLTRAGLNPHPGSVLAESPDSHSVSSADARVLAKRQPPARN